MGRKLFKTTIVVLLLMAACGSAYAEEVVFVINNYGHSVPIQPPDSTVMMLRGSDLEILDTLILWRMPDAHSAAVTKDRKHLWVTCPNAYKIAVIDVRSFEVIDTISLESYGLEPMGIAVTPSGRYVYVTLGNVPYLVKFDAETHEFVVGSPFYLAYGARPNFIIFTPDGAKAYIVDVENAKVFVLQTSSDYVIKTLPFEGIALQDAVVSPDGSRVYVSNMWQNQIEVIRTSDDIALSPIPTSFLRPRGIGISPDGAYLFVGHYDPVPPPSKVTMIRLSDNTMVSSADMADNGRRLTVRHDGSRIFVVDHNMDQCYAFDVVGETLIPGPIKDLNIMEAPDYTLRASPIGIQIGRYPPISYLPSTTILLHPED